jgi:glycosyltransferase involved in cell wall biosynthesis
MSNSRRSVLFVNWRDTSHPAGGGSERYVERIARGLAERGYDVSVLCPRHANARHDTVVSDVRYLRRGGMYTVYLWALVTVLLRSPDVIVDVQNGMPFLSPLVTRRRVLVLVHHLHRKQWRMSYGPVLARLGWWIESRLAPRVYRRCRYVTVSESTRAGLVGLGIDRDRITLVHNGTDPAPAVTAARSPEPLLVIVSRLVPHKRVEHAIDALAELRGRWPTLRLEIVGQGHWEWRLRQYATDCGVADRTLFHGWVDEETKHAILAGGWVHLCPSMKEGWGIAILEAATHGVPSVAYRSAGGVRESILDRRTGLLVDDRHEFTSGIDMLLSCRTLREAMGDEGRTHAARYDWHRSVDLFASAVADAPHAEPSTPAVKPRDPGLRVPVQVSARRTPRRQVR